MGRVGAFPRGKENHLRACSTAGLLLTRLRSCVEGRVPVARATAAPAPGDTGHPAQPVCMCTGSDLRCVSGTVTAWQTQGQPLTSSPPHLDLLLERERE